MSGDSYGPFVGAVTAAVRVNDKPGGMLSPTVVIATGVYRDALSWGCSDAYALGAGQRAAVAERNDGDVAIAVSALLQRFRDSPCERRRVLAEIAQLGI